MSASVPNDASVCDVCTKTPTSCNNLHLFYLIGAVLTLCGCSFVVITYSYYAKLRQHPSVLIFSRSIFDFLFGLCFLIQYYLDAVELACNPVHCNWLGSTTFFCFLCSQLYFAASVYDLYNSLRNPFSQPYKAVSKFHIIIILIALGSTIFIHFNYEFSYRIDLQFCSIAPSDTNINLYNLIFIYVPISALIIYSLCVNIYAFKRLRVGLEDTFYIRMSAIRDSLFYCLGFMTYFCALGLCYFMVWNDDQINNDSDLSDENGWHYVFALTVAFLGINDCGLWIYRQFRLRKSKQNEEKEYSKISQVESLNRKLKKKSKSLRRNTTLGKQFIVPALPEHIHYMQKDNLNGDGTNKCLQCCKRISFKPTIGDDSINKALRREVLAYTTDGIAQSIDRQNKLNEKFSIKNGLCVDDYPVNINQKHGRGCQRFVVQIVHNKHLLYEDRSMSISSSSSASDHDPVVVLDDMDDPNKLMSPHDIDIGGDNHLSIQGPLKKVATELVLDVDQVKGIGKNRQFVDYAPLVFKYVRNKILHITDAEYNRSIIPTDKYAQRNVLDAKFGEGKSGAFFYFSHDNKYLVKTIKKFEVEVMLNTLKEYVKYVTSNPNTILSRTVGLHSIRLYGLAKYFVVTENVFLSQLKPSEIYDLKGSWVNRYTKHQMQSGKTMKDADLKRFIVVKSNLREQLVNQLEKDSLFLASCNIMDYSLLLGIYHMKIAMDQNDNNNNDDNDNKDDNKEEKEKTIKEYAGGIRAEIVEGPGLYYMGIIDTLQTYNFQKKCETFAKTYIKRADGDGISCVEPNKYQRRFMNYMKNIIVTDIEYYKELDVEKDLFESQSLLIYPGKELIDRSIQEAQSIGSNTLSKLMNKIHKK